MWCAHLGEDDHLVDSKAACLCNVVNHVLAIRQAVDARHGQDGLVCAALMYKYGENEVGWRQPVFPYA